MQIEKVEIPLSKIKLSLLLVGAIIFVMIGVFFVLGPQEIAESSTGSKSIVLVVGWLSIIFFGGCAVFIGQKLFDQRSGLIIDEKGIADYSGGTSVGLIEWQDITGIDRLEISSTKMIMIYTNQPEKYIGRAKNKLAKLAMQANHKFYGSPLSISANSLKIKYRALESLIQTSFEQYQQQEAI